MSKQLEDHLELVRRYGSAKANTAAAEQARYRSGLGLMREIEAEAFQLVEISAREIAGTQGGHPMKDSTTDRELTAFAAKAAGLGDVWYLDGSDTPYIGPRYELGQPATYKIFKPLTDDGDALRLAVKLGILFKPEFSHFLSLARFAHQDTDDYAAVRRAITRTAAEIGRGHQ